MPILLPKAGWGVIFAQSDKDRLPDLKEALKPLLQLRQSQTTFYYEFDHDAARGWVGYPNGLAAVADEPISATDLFLAQNGAVPGDPADPKKVPYYLLIVGDPAAVPYEFQIQLAVVYAVGRIYFETLDEYRQYAQSVVAAAQAENRRARAATFFGTANKNDNPTNRSAVELVAPLATALTAQYADWSIRSMVGPGQSGEGTVGHGAWRGADAGLALYGDPWHGLYQR
ncbi:MAG: hypothetical protein R3C43_19900 [Chloroflexota bacterium]